MFICLSQGESTRAHSSAYRAPLADLAPKGVLRVLTWTTLVNQSSLIGIGWVAQMRSLTVLSVCCSHFEVTDIAIAPFLSGAPSLKVRSKAKDQRSCCWYGCALFLAAAPHQHA
eukprot:3865297-Rhodomonas_salina.4